MKKTLFLLLLAFSVSYLAADDFGILVNGTKYFAGTQNTQYIGQGVEYMITGVPMEAGDYCIIYNNGAGEGWVEPLDNYSTQNLTAASDKYNVSATGCYDFYLKMYDYNNNELYVGYAGASGCTDYSITIEGGGGGGGGDTGCQDGPYGIVVNDTVIYAADPTGEPDPSGRVQYMASAQLAVGDVVKLINRSCDARWMVDIDPYGAYQNFTGGASAGAITCTVAGCYDLYIKLSSDLGDILYIGQGENCGDPIEDDPIDERPNFNTSVPERCPDVMLQAFYYDSYGISAPGNVNLGNGKRLSTTRWEDLLAKSDEIGLYFDMVWLPPSGKSDGGTGYHQTQYNNQNSAWGSKGELVEFINRMHKANTKVVADIVINHAGCKSSWCDFHTQYFSPYGTFKPQASWICNTDEVNFQDEDLNCKGAATSVDDGGYNMQDNYASARDWAHSNGQVQAMMKAYLRYMKNVIGFDGWRYDYAQGFKGRYIDMYNSASKNYFSVCEFWNGDYNNVKSYLADCNWNTTVFDFSNKYAAIQGIADGDYGKCVNSGLSGNGDGRYAVTFVDSHDTYFGCRGGRDNNDEIAGCGNSMKDENKDRVLAANAYILARPGIPCVFWPHWVKYKDEISKMVMARQLTGVHSESVISEESAGNGFYKATITGTKGAIRILLGPNSGYGSTPDGYALVYRGGNFAMFYRTNGTGIEVPRLAMTPTQKFRTTSFTVEIQATALTGTPTIYYTTDGTDPTTASTVYSGAITITETTTVKAIAVLNGQTSAIMESTYTYKAPQTTPIVVRFAYDESWEGDVYLFAWEDGDLGGWPGTKINVGTDGWYSYQFPATVEATKFIFNNNNGLQTGDLETDEDVCYVWKNGSEDLDEDCNRAKVKFGLVVSPGTSTFRNNTEGLDVTITAVAAPDGSTPTIYYTLDGTDPTTSSTSTTVNPLVLNFKQTTELRVMAVAGAEQSEVITNVYTYKAPQQTPFNVKFYNTANWPKVYAWAWNADDATINYTGGEWPGLDITSSLNNGWYEFTFPEVLTTAKIIFNNGGAGAQTQDLLIDEDACYVWNAADKKAVRSNDCSGLTDVEKVEVTREIPAKKILRDGNMLIIVGEKTFNAWGQPMK